MIVDSNIFETNKAIVITVAEYLKKDFENDLLNRIINNTWVDQIVLNQIKYKDKYGSYYYPDSFICVFRNNTGEVNLIDGQHRTESLIRLSKLKNYEDILEHKITLYIFDVNNDQHINDIFKIANTKLVENSSIRMNYEDYDHSNIKIIKSSSLNKELIFKNIAKKVINILEDNFINIFDDNITKPNNNIAPRISREQFIANLRKINNINNLKPEYIYDIIIKENMKCKKYMDSSEDLSMKKRCLKIKNNFYLAYYHYYRAEIDKNKSISSKYASCKWLELINFN